MSKKIIFFLGNCFSKNDYERFGFSLMNQKGYKVEGWDFTPWINKKYYNQYKNVNFKKIKSYKPLYNMNEIKNSIFELDSKDIIIDLFLITKNEDIYHAIKKKNIIIGTIKLGNMPNTKDFSIFRKILIKLSFALHNPKKIIFNYLKKIFEIRFQLFTNKSKNHYFNFLIVGGKNWKSSVNFNLIKKTKIIRTHSFDYDKYLLYKDNKNLNKKYNKYSVFLDEDMPYHPDYKYLDIKPYSNPKIYYKEINKFFKDYENKTNIKILIAACPRSDYTKRLNPYDNRKIISGNSALLVKNCVHVFTHMSTSVNFAVLFKKPIIYINSNNYNKLIVQKYINNLSKELEAKEINISEELSESYNNIKINKKKYDFYRERYIKEKNTPKKFIWDIFCNYLESNNFV